MRPSGPFFGDWPPNRRSLRPQSGGCCGDNRRPSFENRHKRPLLRKTKCSRHSPPRSPPHRCRPFRCRGARRSRFLRWRLHLVGTAFRRPGAKCRGMRPVCPYHRDVRDSRRRKRRPCPHLRRDRTGRDRGRAVSSSRSAAFQQSLTFILFLNVKIMPLFSRMVTYGRLSASVHGTPFFLILSSGSSVMGTMDLEIELL